MIKRDFLNRVENENLTHEEINYLLDKLCSLGINSRSEVAPKVVILLKSRACLNKICREEVANYLHMSSRTLSRKLEKEKTGFFKLLDEERKRRCLYYLNNNMLCGQEIAELLGLSDISHFYRSFKNWTGHTFLEAKSKMAKNNSDIGSIFHRHELNSK